MTNVKDLREKIIETLKRIGILNDIINHEIEQTKNPNKLLKIFDAYTQTKFLLDSIRHNQKIEKELNIDINSLLSSIQEVNYKELKIEFDKIVKRDKKKNWKKIKPRKSATKKVKIGKVKKNKRTNDQKIRTTHSSKSIYKIIWIGRMHY